jgi:hypothetical protein
VYAGALFFPFERAAEVLHAWREWMASVPEELTSEARLLQLPPLEQIPEPFRGRSFTVVAASYLGTQAAGSELLGPLRKLAPQMDTFGMVPPAALQALHMDPPDPTPFVTGDVMLRDLPPTAIDELMPVAGPGSGSPVLSVELRHLGGAAARSQPGYGALPALDGSVLVIAVGLAPDPQSEAASVTQFAKISGALEPYRAGHRFYNVVDTEVDPSAFFDPQSLDRLRRVKEKYDPGNLFRANHEIGHDDRVLRSAGGRTGPPSCAPLPPSSRTGRLPVRPPLQFTARSRHGIVRPKERIGADRSMQAAPAVPRGPCRVDRSNWRDLAPVARIPGLGRATDGARAP